MKILILPSWYLPAGAYFIKEQAQFLQEKGIEVHVLSNLSVSLTQSGLDYFLMPWSRFCGDEDGLLTFRYYTRFLPKSEKLNLTRWVNGTLNLFESYIYEHGKPDLIHVHSAMWGGYAAALIKEKYGIPYIITEHLGIMALQSEFAKSQFPEWKTSYFEKAYQKADCIVPVSEQLMRKISQFAPQTNWKAIPNIVDTDFFYYRKRDPKSGAFHFVCVNGYYPEKGYDILLKSFDLFCAQNRDVRLTIAGENFENPIFQKMLKSCANADKITFTGEIYREEVRELLWAADAFLLSSRVESQSIAALEAMSTGLPIICTEVVPEFMIPSFCGHRVAIEDAEVFAKNMVKMTTERNSYDEEKISQHVKQIAHKDVIITQIIDVYEEVLARK
ncbi:MAG: glycosyltransferase [Bacteroidales bacterium]|nr:glycosyltransferase [Bacteroidales bacterium]